MKRTFFIPFAAILLTALFFATACKKDKENSTLNVSTVSFTPCHDSRAPYEKDLHDADSVVVSYSNGTVTVTHFYLTISCDFSYVAARVTQNNDTIRVDEYSDGGYVDCVCETNHTFQINNVKGTRTLVLEDCYPIYCQTFNFQ